MDQILWCYHLNETSSAVLSRATVSLVCRFEPVDEILWCYHSNETFNLVFTWYCLRWRFCKLSVHLLQTWNAILTIRGDIKISLLQNLDLQHDFVYEKYLAIRQTKFLQFSFNAALQLNSTWAERQVVN